MFASFKIIKVDNEIITVNYDGGSEILDGIIEYNISTKEYKILKYTSEHEDSDVFVEWLMNKPIFMHYAKECYENKAPDDKRRIICCG